MHKPASPEPVLNSSSWVALGRREQATRAASMPLPPQLLLLLLLPHRSCLIAAVLHCYYCCCFASSATCCACTFGLWHQRCQSGCRAPPQHVAPSMWTRCPTPEAHDTSQGPHHPAALYCLASQTHATCCATKHASAGGVVAVVCLQHAAGGTGSVYVSAGSARTSRRHMHATSCRLDCCTSSKAGSA
jgi:hypothetical protein